MCRRYMPCHEWGNRRFLACAALCLLLVYLQAPSGEAVTPLTDWQNGIATSAHNYPARGAGTCSSGVVSRALVAVWMRSYTSDRTGD